jgi:hypothetical protein
MDKKYEWVNELDADELRTAIQDLIDENNKLKTALLSGNTKSSVLLVKNSRGTNVEVKAYHDKLEQASKDAQTEYDKLTDKYKEVEE